ncbi:MAG: hypothetical protein ABI438_05615 [Dermatophilaceae bacterium]
MDINGVADELYSRPPEEFTAARNVFEKQAKASGDKQLAAVIHELRKPNTAAWLANQLVREHSDQVRTFLELGSAMRQATEMRSGDQLRELGRQRRELVSNLMRGVRVLAQAAGRKVSQDIARDVEDTLNAALADGAVADQLSAGRLADALQSGGFPPSANLNTAWPTPAPMPPASPKNEPPERRDVQLDRARAEELLAQTDLDKAKQAAQEAGKRLDDAVRRLEDAVRRRESLST